MPDQHQRQAWVLGARNAGQGVEIVNHMLEVDDEGSFTLGASMSDVIVGIHDRALLVEGGGNVPVPSTVLGVAMDQLDDALRLTCWSPAAEEHPALRAVKL
jgi:hypothetical protein